MTQPSIAIVGAGIAGVACANALAAEGIAATVYERSGGVGGRLATTVLPEGAPANILSFTPPLTVGKSHITKLIRALGRALEEAYA